MLVAFRASAVGDTTPKSTIVASGSVQKRQVRANAKTEPTFHMPEDRKVITNYIMSNFLTSSYSVRLHDMYTYIYIYIYIYIVYILCNSKKSFYMSVWVKNLQPTTNTTGSPNATTSTSSTRASSNTKPLPVLTQTQVLTEVKPIAFALI